MDRRQNFPDAIAATVDSFESRIAELERALEHYADNLCEGWCEQNHEWAHFDDCGGCPARRTLGRPIAKHRSAS